MSFFVGVSLLKFLLNLSLCFFSQKIKSIFYFIFSECFDSSSTHHRLHFYVFNNIPLLVFTFLDTETRFDTFGVGVGHISDVISEAEAEAEAEDSEG